MMPESLRCTQAALLKSPHARNTPVGSGSGRAWLYRRANFEYPKSANFEYSKFAYSKFAKIKDLGNKSFLFVSRKHYLPLVFECARTPQPEDHF